MIHPNYHTTTLLDCNHYEAQSREYAIIKALGLDNLSNIYKGTVQEIGLFYTYICTDKDKKVVIPNQMFHQGFVTVHNESCLKVQNDVYSLHTLPKT